MINGIASRLLPTDVFLTEGEKMGERHAGIKEFDPFILPVKKFLRSIDAFAAQLKSENESLVAAEQYKSEFYNNYEYIRMVADRLWGERYALDGLPTFGGVPRVMRICLFVVENTKGSVDEEVLSAFIAQYQRFSPLTIDELCALKTACTAALVNYLCDLCKVAMEIENTVQLAVRDAKNERFSLANIFSCEYVSTLYRKADAKFKIEIARHLSDNGRDVEDFNNLFVYKKTDLFKSLSSVISSLRKIENGLDGDAVLSLSRADKFLIESGDEYYSASDTATKMYYLGVISKATKKRSETVFLAEQKALYGSEMMIKLVEKSNNSLKIAYFALFFAIFSILITTGFVFNASLLILAFPFAAALSLLLRRALSYFALKKVTPQAKSYEAVASKTLIVLCALITDKADVQRLNDRLLEVKYANPGMRCAILADLPKSKNDYFSFEEKEIIENLSRFADKNEYGLIVRKRKKNALTGMYEGYEKKRGALLELNEYLSGKEKDFHLCIGVEQKFEYVITLDEDNFTVCADKLCAAMAHPANRNASVAALRAKGSISSVGKNAFTRIFGGESNGNYDEINSDFERDVLGVGNYTGKGIYRVADFAKKTENAFPDNAILSHDYIEGAFCGAISTDFTVLESVPENYSKSEARRNRWLRGDVQLLAYLFPRIKNKKGEKIVNPLNFSQKMHIFTNIFSAILPIIELIAIIVFCNRNNVFGLFLLFGIVFLPTICSLFSCGLSKKSTAKEFIVNLFELVTIPYRAIADTFAFLLTLVRLITRKNLMEWNTFAKAKGNYSYLIINILFSVLFAVWGVLSGGVLFYIFSAIFTLIFVLPLTELDKKEKSVPLEVEFLKNVGRDTWKYYETQFDSGNYLVNDNFSMNGEKFAKRTSPTNIGLSLCSAVCALKLGFIDRKKFDFVTERIFDRIVALEKWHGHLYNWYDTENGTALYPSYVSTVDSGNFFMCVCYVKPFLSEKCAIIADDMIKSVDFSRLFDWKRNLFYIGYNCFDKRMDAAHYDLMASEALITYIFCLGYNKIPVCSAKALSARFSKKYRCMYSWTGGCFEYTMPLLFVDYSKNSNLFISVRAYEKLQEKSSVCGAWGISESQYRAVDDNGNFMYKAFGLNEVALSPRVSGGVIAPYASITCLAINDKSVLSNIKRLCEMGLYGKFGFYEAFDGAPVMTFMAHHQGMILTAITNYVDGDAKRKLTRDPHISSAMKIIESAPVFERYAYRKQAKRIEKTDAEERVYALFDNAYSSINLICGGNYYLTTGLNGNGKAVYKNAVVYDNICGSGGFDVSASVFGEQKRVTLVRFVKGKTEISETCGGISINCEICTINGFDGERRNFSFENLDEKSLNVNISAKIELILAKESDYSAHPAFNRLFVSVYDRKDGIVLCENRKNGNICGVSAEGITVDFCLRDGVLGADGLITLAPGEKKNVSFCVFCAENKPELEKRAKILGDGRLLSAVTMKSDFAEESGMTIDDCAFAARIQFKKFGSNVELLKNGFDYLNPVRVISVKNYSDVIGLEKKLSSLTKLYKFGYKFDVVIQIGEADGYFSVLKKEVESVIMATGIRKAALNTCKIDTVNEKDGENILKLSAAYYVNSALSGSETKTFYVSSKNLTDYKPEMPQKKLALPNGYFAPDYSFIIENKPRKPFCNVIANDKTGAVINENGTVFSFFENAREEKIGAFFEKGVSEALVLCEKNYYWNISAIDNGRNGYCRHALGYTEYVCVDDGVESIVRTFITERGSRVYEVSLKNHIDVNELRIGVNFALFPVLGWSWEENCTAIDIIETGQSCFCVKNEKNGKRVYIRFNGIDIKLTNEKCRFLEKISKISINLPYFSTMSDIVLRNNLQFKIVIGAECETLSENELNKAINKYSNLSVVDFDFDSPLVYLSKWLPYQVYCSRFYGRTGYYQVSGAYGFRDQLQDCLAMLYVSPEAVKEHILRCAAHQFSDGDVMHWWHEPFFGVRTRIMDDRLFLPYVLAEYISFTGDCLVLGERMPFLKNVVIPAGDESVCRVMEQESKTESLLEHCKRALFSVCDDIAPDGLVYMRGGDWNDGMNAVGRLGKGKSVWLSMFLYFVIGKFLKFITLPGEKKYFIEKRALMKSGVDECFNGKYFLRAINDDGTVVGDQKCDHCKIDLLTQAWAAISGISSREKVLSALNYAEKMLVDEENGIIKLLDPPFTNPEKVGYIGEYPPGVRENGGQYTHAAVWFVYALYESGQNEKAFKFLNMLNPIERYLSYDGEKYGAEPYVMSADVYSGERAGEAGWTWYTGSAAWTYVVLVNKLLGIRIENGVVSFAPALPKSIRSAKVRIKVGSVTLNVLIDNSALVGDWKIVYGGVRYNTNAIDVKLLKKDVSIVVKRNVDT